MQVSAPGSMTRRSQVPILLRRALKPLLTYSPLLITLGTAEVFAAPAVDQPDPTSRTAPAAKTAVVNILPPSAYEIAT